MAVYRLGIYAAMIAALQIIFTWSAPRGLAGDGPNRVTSSDVAAGQWVDSLLGPELAKTPARQPAKRTARRRTNQKRAALRARLVSNPDISDGTPPFALVDRYGDVLRYVEPVEGLNLDSHLGDTVTVRRDTGKTLLASQLAFAGSAIRLTQHEEAISPGEVIGESSILTEQPIYEEGESFSGEPIYGEPLYLEEGIDFGGCPQCGGGVGGCRSGCGFGSRGVLYAHGEYLLWWLEGMNTPPLVTQVPFDTTVNPQVPNGPAATLYGGNRVLEDERHGGRIRLGLWLDDYGQWGVEGEYLGLGAIDERFSAGLKDGNAPPGMTALYIFRPFFNTGILDGNNDGDLNDPENQATRGRALEDVDTNDLDGTVTVDVRSEFQSAGIRLRHNMCCREGCNTCCGDGVSCGSGVGCGSGVNGPLAPLCRLFRNSTRRTDILYGVRWTGLDESLQVFEDLEVIEVGNPNIGDQIDVLDRFETENDFFGGEIGFVNEWEHRRWSLRMLSKVAIGNTNQRVSINGSTTTNLLPPSQGGLLTQRFVLNNGPDGLLGTPDDVIVGNIGDFERDEFSMIPELGLTAGYQLNQRMKLTAGYTLLYWSNIVRPGDQISLDVNANLLPRNGAPPAGTVVLDDEPRFVFRQTDLWAHGLNFGAELTW